MENIAVIDRDLKRLKALMEKDDKPYISAKDAADYLGMSLETFRGLAASGYLRFAIGGMSEKSRYTKIPKLLFYNYFMKF